MTPRHDSIRGWFAAYLHEEMKMNDRIWVLTGDLGFGMFDQIRDDFPKRFLNVGASEQALLGAGIGLALEGQIPFCYSITTFLLYRGFEWIRNYLHHESIPVRLVGSGLNDDYKHDGFTHQPYEAKRVLYLFNNIVTYFPGEKEEIPGIVRKMIHDSHPCFLCLRR